MEGPMAILTIMPSSWFFLLNSGLGSILFLDLFLKMLSYLRDDDKKKCSAITLVMSHGHGNIKTIPTQVNIFTISL